MNIRACAFLTASKFELGQLAMSRGVNNQVASDANFAKYTLDSLRRQASGDWGNMCNEDKAKDEYALTQGNLRIFSSYALPSTKAFITWLLFSILDLFTPNIVYNRSSIARCFSDIL